MQDGCRETESNFNSRTEADIWAIPLAKPSFTEAAKLDESLSNKAWRKLQVTLEKWRFYPRKNLKLFGGNKH